MRESGKPFGNYTLLERLARGGMAEVFLAKQQGPQGFDRLVALKRILPHLMDSEDFVRMFHDEARLAARLSHPNVVHIYEFGKVDEHHFIAMEFVDGVHAGTIIEDGSADPMPPALVARVAADACAGLNHAHRLTDGAGKPLHLVHRDISPPNLMISYEGVVKLVDFGIAKAVDMAGKTMPGIVKGKFAYMSPEQTMGKKLDGRSDVFSLGLVIWEMLAGRVALDRTDPVEAMRCIRDGRLPDIRTVRRDVPPALADILDLALTNKPARRPTAAELGNAFEAFLKSWPDLATPMQLSAWIAARFPKRSSAGEPHDAMSTPVPGPAEVRAPSRAASPVDAPAVSFDFLHGTDDDDDDPTQHALMAPKLELPRSMVPGPAIQIPGPATQIPGPATPIPGPATQIPGLAGPMPGQTPVPMPYGMPGHEVDPMASGRAMLGAPMPRRSFSRRKVIIGTAIASILLIAVIVLAVGSGGDPESAGPVATDESADAAGAIAPVTLTDGDAGADPGSDARATSPDATGATPNPDDDKAWLVVETEPEGATVTLDGGESTLTPAFFDSLDVGDHVIDIELGGYEGIEEELTLEAGENKHSFELDKVRKRRGPGKLNVFTRPSCTAYLGKKKLGKTPFAGKKVAAGSYTLKCEQSGYKTGTQRVRVRSGKTTKVKMNLKKK